MGRSDFDDAYVCFFCHLERRSWDRCQFDHLTFAGRPSIIEGTDDHLGESYNPFLLS